MINEDQLYLHIRQQMKFIREERGLSQARVAQLLCLERTSITNIEGGHQRPNIHILYKFCEAMRLNLDVVFPAITEVTETPVELTITVGGEDHTLSEMTASIVERQLKATTP